MVSKNCKSKPFRPERVCVPVCFSFKPPAWWIDNIITRWNMANWSYWNDYHTYSSWNDQPWKTASLNSSYNDGEHGWLLGGDGDDVEDGQLVIPVFLDPSWPLCGEDIVSKLQQPFLIYSTNSPSLSLSLSILLFWTFLLFHHSISFKRGHFQYPFYFTLFCYRSVYSQTEEKSREGSKKLFTESVHKAGTPPPPLAEFF